MLSIELSVLMAFIGSLLALRVSIPIAHRIRLLDVPHGRKVHEAPTPLVGGVATYIAVLIAFLLSSPISAESIYFLIGGTLVLLVGLADDFKPLGVRLRLGFQCSAIALVIMGTDLYVKHLPIPLTSDRLELGVWGIPFTLIAVVGLMNAFNLVDGIDGLAGSLAILAIVGIFSFATLRDAGQNHTLILLLAVALVPYLLHNLGVLGSKVFLGDAGSMFIGFVLAWTLISQAEVYPPVLEASSVLWCVAIPVIDTLGVMVRRLRKGASPFKPDRDHLHHILMRAGLSSRAALLVIIGAGFFILAFGLVIETVLPKVALLAFAGLFGIYAYALLHAWKVRKFLKR